MVVDERAIAGAGRFRSIGVEKVVREGVIGDHPSCRIVGCLHGDNGCHVNVQAICICCLFLYCVERKSGITGLTSVRLLLRSRRMCDRRYRGFSGNRVIQFLDSWPCGGLVYALLVEGC